MTEIKPGGENENLYQKVVLNNVYKEDANGKLVHFE